MIEVDDKLIFEGAEPLLATLRDFPWHEVTIRDEFGDLMLWERTDTDATGRVVIKFTTLETIND